MKSERGISLIEVLVGTAILGGLIFVITGAIGGSTKWFARVEIADQKAEQVRLAGFNLQKFLQGSRGFQNLSFRVPATTLACSGTGFCVEADRDLAGNPSAGNDVLYVVQRVPLATDLQLAANYAPGAALSVTSANRTTPVSELVAANDYLVLSNVQSSELVQAAAAPAPAGSAGATIALPTAPGLVGTYLANDFVYKARILKVGIDPATHELRQQDLATRAVTTFGKDFERFVLSYQIETTSRLPAACAPYVTGAGNFGHGWSDVNANGCYPALTAIRVEYPPTGGGAAAMTAKYVFKTAL